MFSYMVASFNYLHYFISSNLLKLFDCYSYVAVTPEGRRHGTRINRGILCNCFNHLTVTPRCHCVKLIIFGVRV